MSDFKPSPQFSAFGKVRGGCAALSRDEARAAFPLLFERGEDEGEESTYDNSVAEGDVHVTRGLDDLAVGRDQLEAIDRFCDWDVSNLIIVITHH
jgi:hypothetical protein